MKLTAQQTPYLFFTVFCIMFQNTRCAKSSYPVYSILYFWPTLYNFQLLMICQIVPVCRIMSQVRTQGLGVGGAGLQPPKWKLKKHTSSYHLFCGLPLSLVASKFIYNPFLGIYFLPFSVHAQINVLYLTLLKKKR